MNDLKFSQMGQTQAQSYYKINFNTTVAVIDRICVSFYKLQGNYKKRD